MTELRAHLEVSWWWHGFENALVTLGRMGLISADRAESIAERVVIYGVRVVHD